MKSIAVLVTSGYEFRMYLSSLDKSKERLGIITHLVPNQKITTDSFRSKAKTIFLEDIKKLFLYLEKHLNNELKHELPVFMGYDCAYKIQALLGTGVCNSNTSGNSTSVNEEDAFTVRCLVNVGNMTNTPLTEYFGGESVVTVGNCRKFIDSLKGIYLESKKIDSYC
ncbi:hypothetical protein QGP82_16030 [Leptothoe sp. LEGE 181152]|nr:hypothetical protein [Leptothoe sp. LEGE 181152]